jgi:hypothetical protein
MSRWKAYGYGWPTPALFPVSRTGLRPLGWFAFVQDQTDHRRPAEASASLAPMSRDTAETCRSGFLQPLRQVGGLAVLLHLGAPRSRGGEVRKEEKRDAILRAAAPEAGSGTIARLDRASPRR